MEILAAFDLTGSLRAAAELVGCSHHTVAAHVAARDAGRPVGTPSRRALVTDEYLDKIEEWVEASKGRVRADKVHEKLVASGFAGSDRSTRRAVAEVKKAYRLGHARVHRPWVTEPGLWLQYDFGDGPVVAGRGGEVKTVLFVAWLAWSRFRVVIAWRDKTQPSVIAALDRTFRLLGGVPTYVSTDNEKRVTVEDIGGVPVRNREVVSFGRHYGATVLTCEPADPASKGGVEAAADQQGRPGPTEANLRDDYGCFAELEQACGEFMTLVNDRQHRVTRRAPAEMLAEEQARLHRVPIEPHTVVFGLARRVPPNTPMIAFDHGQYSVPQSLLGEQVWVRATGVGDQERIVIVHQGRSGPVEVARHARATPGSPRIDDDHFGGPGHEAARLQATPSGRAPSLPGAAFGGCRRSATSGRPRPASTGVQRIRAKMDAAVTMAKVAGNTRVDWALGHAAVNGRFGWKDLSSILNAQQSAQQARRATETRSLSQGTAGG